MKLLESHYSSIKRRTAELKRVGFNERQRREVIASPNANLSAVVESLPHNVREVARDIFNPDLESRARAIEKLVHFHDKRLPTIFRQLLFDKNELIRLVSVRSLGCAGVPRDIKLIAAKTYDSSLVVSVGAIEILGGIRGPEMRLAKRMLLQRLQSKSDSNIKKACIQALSIIGDDPLFALYVGEPSRSFTSKKVKVARRFQPKDGTSTVLLGGKLFRRVILRGGRIINKGIQYGTGLSKEAVESWKRAYEFNWSTIGLDYNPIEPILKDKHGKYLIRQNSDGSFRVYAGVIPAFSQFAFSRKEGNLSLSKEAAPTARKIILTLRSIGVDHRHLHGNNLLLRFENGNPRVYVVDFDAAKLLNFLPPHN